MNQTNQQFEQKDSGAMPEVSSYVADSFTCNSSIIISSIIIA